MPICYSVNDRKAIKKLESSKRFTKYPEQFMTNTCQVRVNGDDYLLQDEFIIECKNKILPKKLYLYGKKTSNENALYMNYWLDIFLKTIEKGSLCQDYFHKNNSIIELTIGLPYSYREKAFRYQSWTRNSIIKFLNCLFDNELYEVNYEQQDLFESLLAA